MSKHKALWKQICKFFGIKSVSDGNTKEYTKGKGNGVSRKIIRVEERYLRSTEIWAATFACLFIITLEILILVLQKY